MIIQRILEDQMYFYTKVNMENCKKSFSIELNDTANCEHDGKWKFNTTCNYLDHLIGLRFEQPLSLLSSVKD